MLTIERTPTDGRPPPPGSTFRSVAKFAAKMDGIVVASAELGQAEVFERCPAEPFIAGITWADQQFDAGCAVVIAAADAAGKPVHVHTNSAQHERVGPRLSLLETCGFELFQEKEGLWWQDDGREIPQPESLVFHSMTELGRGPFVELIQSCMVSTLDRTDQLMIQRHGSRDWAASFVEQHTAPADQPSWLMASNPAGDQVGFVGLVERDASEHLGTIALIGVLPTERGRRYGDQLLHAAHHAARRRGIAAILSHTDTVNVPMLNAFARVGASAEGHPWHKWHHIRTAQ